MFCTRTTGILGLTSPTFLISAIILAHVIFLYSAGVQWGM